jgi:hypothetical protein
MANLKSKMVREMEDFSSELAKAKQHINQNQTNLLNTVRDKLQSSSILPPSEFEYGSFFGQSPMMGDYKPPRTSSSHATSRRNRNKNVGDNSNNHVTFDFIDSNLLSGTTMKRPNTSHFSGYSNRPRTTTASVRAGTEKTNNSSTTDTATSPVIGHNQHDADVLLCDTEFTNVEELLRVLQRSEQQVFSLYNETQNKYEEVEKMELENKHLEIQVQEQVKTTFSFFVFLFIVFACVPLFR